MAGITFLSLESNNKSGGGIMKFPILAVYSWLARIFQRLQRIFKMFSTPLRPVTRRYRLKKRRDETRWDRLDLVSSRDIISRERRDGLKKIFGPAKKSI